MSETHYDVGSYAYVLNNPTLYGDLMGLDTTSVPNNNKFTTKEWHDFDTKNSEVRLDDVTAIGKTKSSGNILSQAYYAIRNAGSDHPYFASRPYNVVQYHRQVNAARDPLMDIANVASIASGVGDTYLLARGGAALIKAGIPLIMRRWALRNAARGINIGAGKVIFSDAATQAANRLGFFTEEVAIKNGIAEVPIVYMSSVKPSDVTLVFDALRANGAKSMVINSGPIINGKISTRLLNAVDNVVDFMGFKVTKTGNPENMFILSKKL